MRFNPSIIPRLGLLCLALATSSVQAQTPTVNLRFVSFPKAANPEPVELFLGENKTMEVELPTNGLSDTYEVPALSTWSLGESAADEEGKYVFRSYGNTESVGTKEQLVLVVRKGPDDADGFEITALKSDDQGFGGGQYFLLNASRVDIAGTIGTGKFSLKPDAFQLIAPGPTKIRGGRKYCFAKFYFRRNEGIEPFFSSTWRFNEKARSMVFFYHDPKTKQLRIHTIRSFT